MVQVNLLGKKRKDRNAKNWILISLIASFLIFLLYFLGCVVYVIVRLTTLNREIKTVDNEAVEISRVISSNKEILNKFVLSKFTLDRIALLKKERFRYKDYLDQIAKYIPASGVLTNVDFTTKGWIDVSVAVPGVVSLRELEDNLSSETKLAQSEFSAVFSESVSSDKNGLYNMKLHFQIKSNAGK